MVVHQCVKKHVQSEFDGQDVVVIVRVVFKGKYRTLNVCVCVLSCYKSDSSEHKIVDIFC